MVVLPFVAAAMFAAGPTAPTPASVVPAYVASGAPSTLPARQVFTWRWSDGSKATERTFRKSKYGTVARIPKFEVKVYPAYPPWKAKLLFWVNGAWVPRQAERSGANGRMELAFDPIGPDGTWEDVTWIVRIRLKDISTSRTTKVAPTVGVTELRLRIRYLNK